ncbi:MAG: hypothetical protein EKK40_07095 [Bradyrhizobiaceae bacterium]|nr:MAG: hypothetical protein EKK40_07095 [Bradyrhizobiaceae bacterium]
MNIRGRVSKRIIETIDIIDVERRLLRALKTLRALPDPDRRFFNQQAWPDVVHLSNEAYGYTEATMPRFRPSAFDVSDCLNALEWVRGMEAPDLRLIVSRSFGFSFKQMGQRIGKSDETAARRYKDALLYAWWKANGSQNGKAFTPNLAMVVDHAV